MRFTTDEIARLTNADAVGPPVAVDGVCIDSRTVTPGSLFVPLVAERNGHDFIAAAVESGAVAYLTSEGPADGVTATAFPVDDTMKAFERLGAWSRDRLPDAVIGITGSVGKTTVKDLLASALATTFRTTASEKSFNNELGVPLTLCNAPDDTEVVVQEMGARGEGHIAHLCGIARPSAAIVTMVAAVHTSEFDGLDAVERGKGELPEAIPADGYVVLNAQDARVMRMKERSDARIITFGTSGDVRATAVELDDHLRPRFRLASPWGSTEVRLAIHGVHNVANALAASAAALAEGVPIEALAAGLARASLSPWRMELHHLDNGATLINDSYNANPTSVAAALHSLAELDAARRVAILGQMAEIGDESAREHRRIARLARSLDIELIAVGAPEYETDLHVDDPDGALSALGEVGPDDAILVKASRAAGLEAVAERLLAG